MVAISPMPALLYGRQAFRAKNDYSFLAKGSKLTIKL
jgi:hypothetical protein